jgi:hypothetical protein
MSSDFDQFMKDREAEKANQRTLAEDTEAQWDLLKSLSRSVSDGKTIDGHAFTWGEQCGDDFLQLNNVAAIFRRSQKNQRLQNYQIIFDRHSPSPTAVFLHRMRIASKVWSCEPKMEEGSFVWSVSELGKSYSAEDLSNSIAEELVRYHEEYEEAYRH